MRLVAAIIFLGAASAFPADSDEWGQGGGESSTNCSCGWTNKDEGRIVGGRDAKQNEYPFIVGFSNRGMRLIHCGGTIITPNHVITAAHCRPANGIDNLVAVLGEHQITTTSNRRIEIGIKQFINHEKYDEDSDVNDLALVVLKSEIKFNQYIGPACFPTKNHNLVGNIVRVIGWGRLWSDGDVPETLQKVDLDVVPIEECAAAFGAIDATQLCTFRRGKDSCQGDSGGPVVWLDPSTNRYTLVGVVSYGRGCGDETPGVNTNVAAFKSWIFKKIKETVSSAQTCQKQ